MDRLGWTPRQIETLTEFEYDAILATIDTLASIDKAEREKQASKQRTR